MKKELLLQLPFMIFIFMLVTIFRGWFSISALPFWLGGIIGVLFPYIDHFIYVFLLRPYELTSQRVNFLIKNKKHKEALRLLIDTKHERVDLIIHSVYFQIIFTILTFWVLTSSGSLLGRGIVLAFYLHLLIDQYKDYQNQGSVDRWFKNFQDIFDQKGKTYYLISATLLFLIFAFFL
ncbi:hypothetical protein ACFL15_00985 [Patescibacteria group bacterium]